MENEEEEDEQQEKNKQEQEEEKEAPQDAIRTSWLILRSQTRVNN